MSSSDSVRLSRQPLNPALPKWPSTNACIVKAMLAGLDGGAAELPSFDLQPPLLVPRMNAA